MTDNNQSDLLTQIAAQLATLQQQSSLVNASGWNQPLPAAATPIQGVAVPIKVDTPNGVVRCYLSLPAEVAQSPQSLLNALQALLNRGLPVDIWSGGSSWSRGNDSGPWHRGNSYHRRRY
jgi:hypothetical protein